MTGAVDEFDQFKVEVTLDRPKSGMWHCGPNASWVTVTHLPTMVQARAFNRQQRKARETALACVGLMLDDMPTPNDVCAFPKALKEPEPAAIVRASLEAAAAWAWAHDYSVQSPSAADMRAQQISASILALAADPEAVARIIGEAGNG